MIPCAHCGHDLLTCGCEGRSWNKYVEAAIRQGAGRDVDAACIYRALVANSFTIVPSFVAGDRADIYARAWNDAVTAAAELLQAKHAPLADRYAGEVRQLVPNGRGGAR